VFGKSRKGSSWAQQFVLLAWRSARDSLRNTEVILAKFGISALLGILVGAMYSNVGKGQQSIYDRKGVLFFVTINQAFGLITTVCGTFPKERKIVLRERACNSYHISAYYLAKVSAHLVCVRPRAISNLFRESYGSEERYVVFWMFIWLLLHTTHPQRPRCNRSTSKM